MTWLLLILFSHHLFCSMSFARWQLAGNHSSGFGSLAAGEDWRESWCWQPELWSDPTHPATKEPRGEERRNGAHKGWGVWLQPYRSQSGDEEVPWCHVITRGCWSAMVRRIERQTQLLWSKDLLSFIILFSLSWEQHSVQVSFCFRGGSCQSFNFDPNSMATALDRLLGRQFMTFIILVTFLPHHVVLFSLQVKKWKS